MYPPRLKSPKKGRYKMLSNDQFKEFVIKQTEDVRVAAEAFPEYQRLATEEAEIICKIENAASIPFDLSDKRASVSHMREEFINIHCYMQGWRDALRSMLKD